MVRGDWAGIGAASGHATCDRRIRWEEGTDALTERTFGMVALVVCLSGVFAACASHSKRAAVAPIEPLIPCSFLRNQTKGKSSVNASRPVQ